MTSRTNAIANRPHAESVGTVGGQSAGQLVLFSPGSHLLLPQKSSRQSFWQVEISSPNSHVPSPQTGGAMVINALVSVNDVDKPHVPAIGRALAELGFRLYATAGTRKVLADIGVAATLVSKSREEDAPYLLDLIEAGELDLLFNTPLYVGSASVEGRWRAAATIHNIPLITTITGARAAVGAIRALRSGAWNVRALQDYHAAL